MPVETCTEKGKPGYRWGSQGKCYTYTAGNEASRKKAKQKAHLQGAAIGKAKADDEPLTDEEYKHLIEIVVDEAAGRVPVLVGCLRAGTQSASQIGRFARDAGADALMVLAPYYYSAQSADRVYDHFKQIAADTQMPIMIYNNQGVTGQDLKVDLLRRMADIEEVIAIKECTSVMGKIRELCYYLADRWAIIPAWTQMTMPFDYQLGAVGFVTLYGNVNPGFVLKIHDACLANDFELCQDLYEQALPLNQYIFGICGSQGPDREVSLVKEMGRLVGRPMGSYERNPIAPASDSERSELKSILGEMGWL